MNKQRLAKLLLAAGVIFLAATFIIGRYVALSDVMNGFLKGMGIGLLIMALVKQVRLRRAN